MAASAAARAAGVRRRADARWMIVLAGGVAVHPLRIGRGVERR
ncbi:hypothetical protein [Xanthomonas sp.]|nr:hypothetical protein [Xanthomonas sp.]